MLIKEYRISLPMSVEEYRIAQLYMIQKKSRQESHGAGSGVEILENTPYTEGPGGSGQYTYKIYHIGSHLPGWFRAILPKSALRVEEEAWNAYPYTKTRYKCPFIEKFLLEIETKYLDNGGTTDNIFNMSPSDMRQRVVDVLDIVRDPVTSGDYSKEEDPKLYKSSKTGRGPLEDNWREDYSQAILDPSNTTKAIMTAYKLCKVEFRYWGMQNKIERFIHDIALRKTMLRAHRQAWCWQDEWSGLTLNDIRQLELETQLALQEKMAAASEEEGETAKRGSIKGDNSVRFSETSSSETQDNAHLNSKVLINRTASQESSATIVNGESGPRRRSLGSSKRSVGGSSRDVSEWRFESLEQLQESSSDEDEFFDAQEGMEAEGEEGHRGRGMVRSSSMEMVSSGDEYADALSEETNFGRRVEQFRMMYSVDASLPSSLDLPHPQASGACPVKILFLVLHGGSVLDSGKEPTKRSDFLTLRSTFETVIQSHYHAASGQLAFRHVPSPQVCSDTLSILSSLSPYHFESQAAMNSGENTLSWSQDFVPLGAIALFASSSTEYQDHVNTTVVRANQVFQEFLSSDEGRGFAGQICILADSTGSLLAYDALTRASQHSMRGGSRYGSHNSLEEEGGGDSKSCDHRQSGRRTLQETKQLSQSDPDLAPEANATHLLDHTDRYKRSKSEVVPPDFMELRRQGSSRQNSTHLSVNQSENAASRRTSTGSHFESSYTKFEFDVSDFFMCGSPLGLVLAYRRLFSGEDKNCPPLKPSCHQVYNLFHSNDPIAIRLEPLVQGGFRHVPPIKISRFSKFPLGDGEPIHVVETVQNHLSLFTDGHRHSVSPGHPSLQRQSSTSSVSSTTSGVGETAVTSITNVTSRWWGTKRIDFVLYCPEVLHSFPTNALPHLFHASFWESTDVVAFILRQVLRHDAVADTDRTARGAVSTFTLAHPREKWLKRRTTIKVRNLQPNHRANDVIVLEDKTQVLSGKFMYGSLDITSLSGEKVDVYIMTQPPSGDWVFIGTEVTDGHGRLVFEIPTEKRLNQGMYPVKMIVKGDHTSCDFYLTVLPPKTETVIFSIDGSFTASVSIMGKDPKVRAGAVDVVRHWQELGYLIMYVTARPDMQHRKVVSWLANHNFPHGMVAFMDGFSKDPLRQKLNYLKALQNEAQIVYKSAYGSSKDISLYKELGVGVSQIFIVGKASKKQHAQAQIISDGYAAHLTDLMSPGRSRPAVGNARMFLRKSCFRLPRPQENRKMTKRTISVPCHGTTTADLLTSSEFTQNVTTKITVTDTAAGDQGSTTSPTTEKQSGKSPSVKKRFSRTESAV
ncbi:protein retinal degeneration B-like [Haliotis cracherodii]|uniref:protein retinal degeneration B-like n=1 Tax=Haliotis cracherodii TaxID=6455 RepID=UPI0039ED2F7E